MGLRKESKDLNIEAKNFDDLVLNGDTLSTPNEFMLSGKTDKLEDCKQALFTEHFGLLYTDAAHIILHEANRNLKTS